MRALEVNLDKLQQLNTIPLGLSVDPLPTKKAWAASLLLNRVSLPSDFWPHGKISQDYGVFIESEGISERANIIIDEKGVVRWVKVYPMGELPNLNEIIQFLSNM